jgi:hypothetical protein
MMISQTEPIIAQNVELQYFSQNPIPRMVIEPGTFLKIVQGLNPVRLVLI